MKKTSLVVLASLGAMSGVLAAENPQPKVETQGLTRKIIEEQVLSGPLSELNGKYKMVAVDFAIAPGGYVGPHHHAGPGYRCVVHGVVTNVEEDGKSTDYGAGECYFEGGDKSHVPRNNGDTMVLGVQVELLPATWSGSSLLPVGPGVAKDARGVDPLKVAPEHYKVIFENERVRVLSFHSSPGEKWPLHMHPDAVTVSLTDYKLRNVVPGTEPTVIERKGGDAYWIPARSHTGENIGTTDMDSIIVELKEPSR